MKTVLSYRKIVTPLPMSKVNRLLKKPTFTLRGPQGERTGHEIVYYFPFMLIIMKAMYSVTAVIKMTDRGGEPLWNTSHWMFIRSIPGHE